jgi:hypothetical protein
VFVGIKKFIYIRFWSSSCGVGGGGEYILDSSVVKRMIEIKKVFIFLFFIEIN